MIFLEDAILVGLDINNDNNFEDSMHELANLALACNVNVLHSLTQKRENPTANYYIGKGKVK